MAPEVRDGQPATPTCDRYALGVMAFQLLTGRDAARKALIGERSTSGRSDRRAYQIWLNGAAPESNRASRGLHDRTGFEDSSGYGANSFAARLRRDHLVSLQRPPRLGLLPPPR